MKRLKFAIGLVVLAVGGVFIIRSLNPSIRPGGPQSKPNIILITMDTVRADHVSVYGYPRDTTPFLKEFARESTLYTRAIAASDYTLPTHASIFTGLYPSWHGAILERPLGPNYPTLAEMLHKAGYWTVAAVANVGNLQPAMGLNRGFDTYLWGRPLMARFWGRPLFSASAINRKAIKLLNQRPDKPFFLFLNYMDAHRSPYPPEFTEINNFKKDLSSAERTTWLAEYDSAIASIDTSLKSLFAELKRAGLHDNTLIIVTSDHGEAFGEHHLMAHAVGHVYQELVHVPLLIKYPHQTAAQRITDLAGQVDLMPTVLDVVGVSRPAKLQGRDLRLPGSSVVYSSAEQAPTPSRSNSRFRGIRRAVFSGSLKLITWTNGASELFDLNADPHETTNQLGTVADGVASDPRAQELASLLTAFTAGIPHSPNAVRRLDDAAIQRLKSLGYVQ